MISLAPRSLAAAAEAGLAAYQAEVDTRGDFDARKEFARSAFRRRNTKTNPTFRVVRGTLATMCPSRSACMYCESNEAMDIDHFRPMTLYPESTFRWPNYLYACSQCNRLKGDRFMLLGSFPALLNPRADAPLNFMRLDVAGGTFRFVPIDDDRRAKHTIDALRLNERPTLTHARREAYEHYCARLSKYITDRDAGRPTGPLVETIQNMAHPTVWHEMRRQHRHIPELAAMFASAPEALSW